MVQTKADSRSEVNVLFTSAGRRVELLRAFRNAYKSLQLDGKIIALDINPLAPSLQVADLGFVVPRLDSPDYIPVLQDICRKQSVDLIFPLIDPDIPLLAKHRDTLESTGARIGVIGIEAAQVISDKWETTQFFQSLGLPTPSSWLPDSINLERVSFPLFIKPRNGSASKHTYPILNRHEYDFFSEYVPDPIIQESIPGPEITSDVLCDLDGNVLSVVSRQRLEVRGGEVSKGVTVYNKVITDACVAIAHALPAVGPITVQCMMKDGNPYFTEINARFGGGIPLGIAAGVDSPRLLLERAAGDVYMNTELGSYQTGLTLSRFDESFFLCPTEQEQIPRHMAPVIDSVHISSSAY